MKCILVILSLFLWFSSCKSTIQKTSVKSGAYQYDPDFQDSIGVIYHRTEKPDQGFGSGFLVAKEGRFIIGMTNHHVFEKCLYTPCNMGFLISQRNDKKWIEIPIESYSENSFNQELDVHVFKSSSNNIKLEILPITLVDKHINQIVPLFSVGFPGGVQATTTFDHSRQNKNKYRVYAHGHLIENVYKLPKGINSISSNRRSFLHSSSTIFSRGGQSGSPVFGILSTPSNNGQRVTSKSTAIGIMFGGRGELPYKVVIGSESSTSHSIEEGVSQDTSFVYFSQIKESLSHLSFWQTIESPSSTPIFLSAKHFGMIEQVTFSPSSYHDETLLGVEIQFKQKIDVSKLYINTKWPKTMTDFKEGQNMFSFALRTFPYNLIFEYNVDFPGKTYFTNCDLYQTREKFLKNPRKISLNFKHMFCRMKVSEIGVYQ